MNLTFRNIMSTMSRGVYLYNLLGKAQFELWYVTVTELAPQGDQKGVQSIKKGVQSEYSRYTVEVQFSMYIIVNNVQYLNLTHRYGYTGM